MMLTYEALVDLVAEKVYPELCGGVPLMEWDVAQAHDGGYVRWARDTAADVVEALMRVGAMRMEEG